MVLLFTNLKGGVGKSTLSAHLAVYLYDRGTKVALIDADKQLSSSEWLLEAEPKLTIRQVGTPEAAAEAVVDLKATHDVLVVDAPGDINDTARTLMLLTDLAVFPVGPSVLELRSLAKTTPLLKYARQINAGRPEGRIVLNKVRKQGKTSRKLPETAAQLDVPVCQASVRDLEAFREAPKEGTVVTRMDGPAAAEARRDLELLFEELLRAAAETGAIGKAKAANE